MERRLRTALSVLALLALGGLALRLGRGAGDGPPGNERLGVAVLILLLPVVWAIAGLLLRRVSGRWFGLALGIAVFPWAAVFALGPTYGAPRWPGWVALAAATTLLLALTGHRMFEVHEGRSDLDWKGFRMGLLRWTLIFNIAAAFALCLFVTAYRADTGGFVQVGAWLLLGLIAGVWLLAYQKTVGLVLLAASCLAFAPLGAIFLAREARSPEEAWLLVAIFAPGVLLGWASLAAFGRPILRFLRAR